MEQRFMLRMTVVAPKMKSYESLEGTLVGKFHENSIASVGLNPQNETASRAPLRAKLKAKAPAISRLCGAGRMRVVAKK
jgi:hypothetical protein